MSEKSIPEQIAELREMRVPDLVVRYQEVHGKPPRVKHRDWLWRRIAWKIQEQKFGGLSIVAKRRLDELIAELDLPLGLAARTTTGRVGERRPVLGTSLCRTWRGRDVRATAVDGGWEHDGTVYKTLSAAANAITGAHMSGPKFFGVAGKGLR
jgi:hypothetical protein